MGRHAKTEAQWKADLVKKYGKDIFSDLQKADSDSFGTLQAVAEKHGITRERARQIYNQLYGKPFRQKSAPTIKELHEKSLSCKYHPFIKCAEYKEGIVKTGAIYEKLFWKECEKKGFAVSLYGSAEIDMVVNGYLVDVKYRRNALRYCKKETSYTSYYNYHISLVQLDKADFIACYHPTEESFFIIPVTGIKKQQNKNGKTQIYISEKKSNSRSSRNVYWEFRDAWQLLSAPKP